MGLAFTSNVASGNALVAGTLSSAGVATVPSDTRGNTWLDAVDNGQFLSLYYVKVGSSGGADTVTNNPGITADIDLQIFEVSQQAATPLDATGSQVQNTGTTFTISTSGATAQANELVLAMFSDDTSGAITFTAGSGYALLENTQNGASSQSTGGESKVVSSTGVQTATVTGIVGGNTWEAVIATFKSAPVAHTQVVVATNSGVAGGVQTFTAAAGAAGRAWIICAEITQPSAPTNCTITATGWVFTLLGTIRGNAAAGWVALFGAISPDTVSRTFTITWTGASGQTFLEAIGDEFSGNDTTGGTTTFDNTAVASGNSTGPTVNITPANADDGLWGVVIDSATVVGSGFTKAADDGLQDWSEFKILVGQSGVAQTVNFTGGGGDWTIGAVTIKPAGGAVAGPAIPPLLDRHLRTPEPHMLVRM